MVQTLATDSVTNDIFIGTDGKLSILSGQPAVQGACGTKAKSQLKEMIYAQNAGMPNFEVVWVGVPNLAAFEAAYRQNIAPVAGVVAVQSFAVADVNNELSYAAVIENEFGAAFAQTGVING